MFFGEQGAFEALLPRIQAPVRIACVYDAQIFVRRWTIRDKDVAIKALARRLDRVDGGQSAVDALSELRKMLVARGLLIAAHPE
jgi:hypothetical protein